jgi:hypothetical protein
LKKEKIFVWKMKNKGMINMKMDNSLENILRYTGISEIRGMN